MNSSVILRNEGFLEFQVYFLLAKAIFSVRDSAKAINLVSSSVRNIRDSAMKNYTLIVQIMMTLFCVMLSPAKVTKFFSSESS